MKRQLALALAIIFALLSLSACGQTAVETPTEEPTRTPTPQSELEGLTSDEIMQLLAEDKIYFEHEQDKSEPTEEPDYSGRTVITLGQYGEAAWLSGFNSSQDEYVIEYIDYSQGGTLSKSDAIIKLKPILLETRRLMRLRALFKAASVSTSENRTSAYIYPKHKDCG